jgi:large subunit ribosomal protein L6
MSKVGKQILNIPAGVTVNVSGHDVSVKGKLGEVKKTLDNTKVEIVVEGATVSFKKKGTDSKAKSLWGTYAAHIKNMMIGVTTGYAKKLLVEGVGYKWEVIGKEVKLMLGFSHPIMMKIPEGLTVKTEKGTMDISGFDKEVVGLFAKNIRQLKTPEPYKGKGIRYSDEVIRRKQGKRSA